MSAVNVLKRLSGVKCIITPGVVDGGVYSSLIMDKLSVCLDGLDDIVLVNNKEVKILKSILNKRNIKFVCVNSFVDALSYIKSKYVNFSYEYVNILIENDLPDNYLMRWVYEFWRFN